MKLQSVAKIGDNSK